MQHMRCDVIRRAIGTIDHDLHAMQIEFVRETALAEFDVATGGVIDAASPSQLARRTTSNRTGQTLLDFVFHGIR